MTGDRSIRSLGFEAPFKPYFSEYGEGPPGRGQVRLDTLYSGFSAGTELSFLKASNPYLHSRWDDARGRFFAGEPQMRFPVPFVGYMEVGRVVDDGLPGFAAGDVVAGTWGHKSGHTADPLHDLLVPLGAIDPLLGIFAGQMGPIAANGILHADAEMLGPGVESFGAGIAGRPVIVFGGGTVGLLVALFARGAGAAEVIVAEPSEFRRLRALSLGLDAMTEDQAVDHAKTRWHGLRPGGRGADIVFQTRPDPASLHRAMQALRPQGMVIDLAFYQAGADALRLGEEFHHNALTLRCAQIGRVPRNLEPRWDRARLSLETVRLLIAHGPAIRSQMVTQIVPIEEAPRFLEHLVRDRPNFIQIVFDYHAR